jgi:hypothetical protein
MRRVGRVDEVTISLRGTGNEGEFDLAKRNGRASPAPNRPTVPIGHSSSVACHVMATS